MMMPFSAVAPGGRGWTQRRHSGATWQTPAVPDPRRPRREVRYSLRLPPELHDAIVEIALWERRSLNREIEVALRAYVAAWRRRRARSEREGPTAHVAEEPEAPYEA
jgi:hypothetical protein